LIESNLTIVVKDGVVTGVYIESDIEEAIKYGVCIADLDVEAMGDKADEIKEQAKTDIKYAEDNMQKIY
jgi:hypothetical protein